MTVCRPGAPHTADNNAPSRPDGRGPASRLVRDPVWGGPHLGELTVLPVSRSVVGTTSQHAPTTTVDVDLDANRVRVNLGEGGKDRLVPFPATFAETLALHMDAMRRRGAVHLFESSWKEPYNTRGVTSVNGPPALGSSRSRPG